MRSEIDVESYKKEVLKAVTEEVNASDPVLRRCRRVEFESWSNGRGKKKKDRPRHVELLVVDGEYAHQVKNGQVQPRTSNDHIAPDVLAEEVLGHLPKDERTLENLFRLAGS